MSSVLAQIISRSPRLAATTKSRYLGIAREFERFAGNDPSRWSTDTTQLYYARLLARIRPQSANAQMSALKYLGRRLAELRDDPRLDFARGVELAAVHSDDEKEQRALTADEAQRLLMACPVLDGPIGVRDHALIYLGLHTGMRRFSLAGIRFADLGFDSRLGIEFVEITIKGGKRHKVPLSPHVRRNLEPWIDYLDRVGVKSGSLFRSLARQRITTKPTAQVGEGLREDGIYRALKARAAKAGIADFHPHILRHSFISWCKAAGMSNAQIAAITGHVPREGGTIDRVYTDHLYIGSAASDAVAAVLRR